MKYFHVDSSTTVEQLKAQYREQSKRLHPDRGGKQEEFVAMTEEFKEALRFVSTKSASPDEQLSAFYLLRKITRYARLVRRNPMVSLGILAVGGILLANGSTLGEVENFISKAVDSHEDR